MMLAFTIKFGVLTKSDLSLNGLNSAYTNRLMV